MNRVVEAACKGGLFFANFSALNFKKHFQIVVAAALI